MQKMLNRGGAGFALQSDAGGALEAVAGDAARISPCEDAFTDDDTCSKSVDLSTAFFQNGNNSTENCCCIFCLCISVLICIPPMHSGIFNG